jgi:2'-5' RNA ligase
MVRLFVALEISDEIIANLTQIQSELISSKASLRFIEPESFHITIKFLGEVEKGKIPRVIAALKKIQFSTFSLTASQVTVDDFDDPHWVWCTIDDDGNGKGLKKIIDDALTPLGIPVEERFTPHISLARVNSTSSSLFKQLDKIKDTSYGSCVIKKVKLKESLLTLHGPFYEDFLEINLMQKIE